jgi:hypothetical protein
MFEQASRMKLRFDSTKGPLTVEDLWDLNLTSNGVLDKIAVGLSRQLKEDPNESFVSETRKTSDDLQLRFDIVKHIIDVKKAERAAEKAKADAAATKRKILEIMERKQDQALEGKTLEELQAMVATL